MQKCIFAYIFQRKMFSCAKMHLMQKCIFATHHILRSKMFSITFSKGKCSASHFPKENVQQSKMLQMHLMLCKNIFLHHILLVQKCCVFCFAKNKDALQKYIFASHFVGAKMLCFLLCKKQRCCAKMHFCITFCFAEHFPLENVR